MRASILLLGSLVLAAGAAPASAALAPRPPHDIGRAHVEVTFNSDGTYLIDVLTPPDWLLLQLEPLAPIPADSLVQGEARDRRLAELTGTFADWIWVMFDGERVEAHAEYIPTPINSFDPSKPPFTTMRLRGEIPAGAKLFSFAFGLATDPYPMLTTARDGSLITSWVGGPVESEHQDIASLTPPSRWEVVLEYLKLGYTHILPKGADHILFVIGIYLLSTRVRPILLQVTSFTLAHTITLGLTIFGVISLRSSIVEPMIALSIAYVAVENLFTTELKPWRLALVFAFGLLHGMGFAGVLRELGLPRSERVTALLSFNIGVEGGQLTVIAGMFLAVGWLRDREWYHRRVVVPISVAIAAVGLYWTVTRIARG
jgi:hydrogenase/urease accessory protein HupE